MDRILRNVVCIAAFAVFCILIQPAISNADTYEVLEELSLSNGKYKTIVTPQVNAEGDSLYGFKGLKISVQNGTEDSKYHVASARVSVDGREVFSQNDFNSSYVSLNEFLEYPEETTGIQLEVRVSGTWKSALAVTVTGVYEDVLPTSIAYYLDEDGDGMGGFIMIMSEEPLFYPWVTVGNDIDDTDPSVQ